MGGCGGPSPTNSNKGLADYWPTGRTPATVYSSASQRENHEHGGHQNISPLVNYTITHKKIVEWIVICSLTSHCNTRQETQCASVSLTCSHLFFFLNAAEKPIGQPCQETTEGVVDFRCVSRFGRCPRMTLRLSGRTRDLCPLGAAQVINKLHF